MADSPDWSAQEPQGSERSERRRYTREERRNSSTRSPGTWDANERERRVAEIREQRRDDHATTIQRGEVVDPATDDVKNLLLM